MKKFYIATTLLGASLTVFAQTAVKQPKPEKKSVAVSQEHRDRYADFLKSPNTGLIRLFPREKKYVVKAGKRRDTKPPSTGSFVRKSLSDFSSDATDTGPSPITHADVPSLPETASRSGTLGGNGAYYSFSELTHEYGPSSDLLFERGLFRVGFSGANYGFLTNLGDVPLDTVDLNTPLAKLFADYIRAAKEQDARREQARFWNSVEIEGANIRNNLAARPHSTYLLRSVNYEVADLLVAFKVVDIDSDGSLIILWKLLKKFPTPNLVGK